MKYMGFSIVLLLISLSICNGQSAFSELRQFIFGHSLVDYRTVQDPTNETTSLPYWTYQFCQADDRYYSVGGMFGFMQNYVDGPVISQWG